MQIRRYELADIPAMVDHIEAALSVTQFRDIFFSREKMTRLLSNNHHSSQFFAALATDDDGNIIGGICGNVCEFIFSHEALANDNFFYVAPSHRRLRTATGLVEAYLNWAKERKVKRVQLSNSMGVKIEEFSKLATRLGFEQQGTIHQMRL